MQFSAQHQVYRNTYINQNPDFNFYDTPFDPAWATGGHPDTDLLNLFRDIAFQAYFPEDPFFNNSFFSSYPNFTQHRDEFLQIAAEYQNLAVAQAMYNDGADINGLDDTDIELTPFALALKSQNLGVIRWMLSIPDIDPNVRIADYDEADGLAYAILNHLPYDIIESMLERGANIDDDDDDFIGWYPLSAAVHTNNHAVIQLLLFYGADAQFEDDEEQIPADYAAEHDQVVRDALNNWSEENTQSLRQWVGNDPAGLSLIPERWLQIIEADLNQGMATMVMC